jgi:hypothetical protein
VDHDQGLVAKRTQGALINKEQYTEVQRIFKLLVDLSEKERHKILEESTSDEEVKKEVLELLKNTSDQTIIGKSPTGIQKEKIRE